MEPVHRIELVAQSPAIAHCVYEVDVVVGVVIFLEFLSFDEVLVSLSLLWLFDALAELSELLFDFLDLVSSQLWLFCRYLVGILFLLLLGSILVFFGSLVDRCLDLFRCRVVRNEVRCCDLERHLPYLLPECSCSWLV